MSPSRPSLPPLSIRPHPHLIEIPAWAWLEELSARLGSRLTLGQVPDAEWDRLRDLGFDLVWLMGIWERSPQARHEFRSDPRRFAEYDRALPGWKLKDVVGSPYAVHDYRPDPRIGTWREVDQMRRKLRERGMGLILDFVPNHTAQDHAWVRSHPEYYVEGTEADFRKNPALFRLREEKDGTLRFFAHGRDPYFPPWPDTAQLNHFAPGTRQALVKLIGRLARHADGLRCDMAMLPLNDVFAQTWHGVVPAAAPASEFWPEAIAAAPGMIWLAEAYWGREGQLQQLGFPFTYDKPFCDFLRAGSAGDLRRHLGGDFSSQRHMTRFLENHDEQRSAAVFGHVRIQAAATLAATAPGLRLYFHGQIEGRKIHQPIELARAVDETADPFIRPLYERLLHLSHEDVFHTGRWKLLDAVSAGDGSHVNLVVYQWRSNAAWKLIAANPTGAAAQGRVALGAEAEAPGYVLTDQLNNVNYSRSGREMANGLYIGLDAGRAHLFDIRAAG